MEQLLLKSHAFITIYNILIRNDRKQYYFNEVSKFFYDSHYSFITHFIRDQLGRYRPTFVFLRYRYLGINHQYSEELPNEVYSKPVGA